MLEVLCVWLICRPESCLTAPSSNTLWLSQYAPYWLSPLTSLAGRLNSCQQWMAKWTRGGSLGHLLSCSSQVLSVPGLASANVDEVTLLLGSAAGRNKQCWIRHRSDPIESKTGSYVARAVIIHTAIEIFLFQMGKCGIVTP